MLLDLVKRYPRLAWIAAGTLALGVVWYGIDILLPPIAAFLAWVLWSEVRWARARNRQLAQSGQPWPGIWQVFRERRIIYGWPLLQFAKPGRLMHTRAQWQLASTDAPGVKLVAGKDKRTITLNHLRPNVDLDLECDVNAGKIGLDMEAVAKSKLAIAKIVGCEDITVKFTKPGCGHLTFHWTEPLGRVLNLADLPTSPMERLSYGRRVDGTAASIFAGLSLLVGGLTRHGKSNTIWDLLADANRKGMWVDLYVSDPKNGLELRLLGLNEGQQMNRLRVRKYVSTAQATTELVKAADEALQGRQRQQKNKNWQGGTKENPLVVVILDELLPLQDMIKQGITSPLGHILFTGAASGYVVWANAQVGHAEALGVLRNLIPQRICVATPTADVTDTILGTGAAARGALCHRVKDRGIGWAASDDTRDVMKFRGALVTDADMEVIAVGGVPAGMNDEPAHDDQQVAVYSLMGYAGQLLYVGQTNDLKYRWAQHRADDRKPWCGDADDPENLVDWDATVQATIWYPNLKRALAEEEKAIKSRFPIYNDIHNRENPGRRIIRRRKAQPEAVTEPTVVEQSDDLDGVDLDLLRQLAEDAGLVEDEDTTEPEGTNLSDDEPARGRWPLSRGPENPQQPGRPPRARRTKARRPHPTTVQQRADHTWGAE